VPFWDQSSHVHHISSIIQNPLVITHTPSHSCILISPVPSFNSTITYRSTIQGQEEHQDETHSRLAPRLGLRASPRRESFAQASSLRLGESSRIWNNGLYTFSLGRDSPRLSETLACSKLSESPGRPFAREGLGEPLLTSPRQDKLAWARLSVATTVRTCSSCIFTHQRQHQPFHAFTATY